MKNNTRTQEKYETPGNMLLLFGIVIVMCVLIGVLMESY